MLKKLFGIKPKAAFQARSSDRDAVTDFEAVLSVATAIDIVLKKADRERAGLKARMDDVASRAAIVGGNDNEDYASRTAERSKMLRDSDTDLQRGQQRLQVIDQNMSHFRFLRTELQARFPEVKL